MNCRNGHPNPNDGAAFCSACGVPLSQSESVGQASNDVPLSAETTSRPKRSSWWVAGAAAAAVVLIAAAFFVFTRGSSDAPKAATEPETFTASGVLVLTDEDLVSDEYLKISDYCNFDDTCSAPEGLPCAAGSAGYSDIAAGTQVTVTGSDGEVLALGALEPGGTQAVDDVFTVDYYPPCVFPFEVHDIPDTGEIYGLEVSHRGVIQFTKADAESLAVSLGD